MNNNYVMKALLFTAVTAGGMSCKKTVSPDPLPQNLILSYAVTNLPDSVIYGAINNTEKSITVYVPYYYGLTLIDPAITISEGARLVEKIEPIIIEADTSGKNEYVLNGGKTITYTVKAKDSTSNTYTLRVVKQGTPSLFLRWGNATSAKITYPNAVLPSVSGNFYTKNMAATSWYLTDSITKKVVKLPALSGNFSLTDSMYSTQSAIILPADLDTGYYKVGVSYLGYKAEVPTAVRVTFTQPTPGTFIGTRITRQGDTLNYPVAAGSVYVNPTRVTVEVNGAETELPIVSFTRTTLIVRVPDNFPAGTYDSGRFRFYFNGWSTIVTRGNLIVSAKP